MNRMDLFLKEVEVWGFQKQKDSNGNLFFCHEFFIHVAPNLMKYLKPLNSIRSLQAVQDQILSPPRIGRLNSKNANSRPLDAIFCGKRKEQESSVAGCDESGIAVESQNVNSSVSGGPTSPVTPSFTLANHVSPNNIISPRGRLQSNRGKGKVVIMFPVSKRGRRTANVSSRGGRCGGIKLDMPL